MKHITKLKVLSVLFLVFVSLNAQFSEKEKTIIYTESIALLAEYESTVNNIGDIAKNSMDEIKSLGENLNELFINRKIMVYNDLDPNHTLSEFYEIETYTSNLILWYPDGIKIKLDFENILSGNINSHEEGVYSIDLNTVKSIDGNYLNKQINSNKEKLSFRIAFSKSGNQFNNFRIVGIRKTGSENTLDNLKAMEEVNSAGISEEEREKIIPLLKTVLNDYRNYLALLGDADELEEDKDFYAVNFKALFLEGEQILLHNDLDPKPDPASLQVDTYLELFKEAYPEGIKNIGLNIDSAEYGTIIKKDNGKLYCNIYIDKFFSGNFKGNDLYRFASELVFKVGFEKSGNSYKSFLIESVDPVSMDFYAETSEEQAGTPQQLIKPANRKGWYLGFTISGGQGLLENQVIKDLILEQDFHKWTQKEALSYGGSFDIQYFLNDHLSIGSGIRYAHYSSTLKLNSESDIDTAFTDGTTGLDPNLNSFYKKIDANYDSAVQITTISLPISLQFISGKPGKYGFYVQSGVMISYVLNATYNVNGDYQYYGYYPQFEGNEGTRVRYDEELGYYSRQDLNLTETLETNKIILSAYFSGGLNIPLGYFSEISVGPYFNLGLSNINEDSDYIDVFGRYHGKNNTVIRDYGIQLVYRIKL